MLLIPTCSQDTTTDMLMPHISGIDVFRFNIDKWNEYAWDFSSAGFEIHASDGKILTSANLKLVFLRKPMFLEPIEVPKFGCLDNWCRREIERLWQDLYYDMAAKGRAALVHPAKSKWHKHTQMMLAQKYFKVPEYHIVRGHLPAALDGGDWVVKSLTQELIGEGKIFICKRADVSKLDPYYPWFLQRRIEAEFDITSLYVNGRIFSFRLAREKLSRDDCRLESINLEWEKCVLSPEAERAITAFMRETGFDFGRFDFLQKGGELYFLELNPNGQWGWLDIHGKHGIFECVAAEIMRAYRR